jgi:prolyl oligopeptidase
MTIPQDASTRRDDLIETIHGVPVADPYRWLEAGEADDTRAWTAAQNARTDMLRYHLFRIARLWIPEYGSAEEADAFRWLRAYSPYHRVEQGVCYPSTLLTTAEQDGRVDPMHARKMAALLQHATACGADRPILLRAETHAGHGAGKPLAKRVAEAADLWGFVGWQLGLDWSD